MESNSETQTPKLWTQRQSRDPAERTKQSNEPHWSDLDPTKHRLPQDDETILWDSPLSRFVDNTNES